ncbi:MAG: hypothetical protein A2286_09470 [Gammaproteobacteria bacterium RIFOXYA12_FULL_61_12]|nr:MAG: hypothetical protein A2286_09470 [Gammaproteobacteria bacterium RIFOXYA12_FULL_61_12]
MKPLLISGWLFFALSSEADELPDLSSMERAGEALILDKQHHHAFVHYADGNKGHLALEQIIGWTDSKAAWETVDSVPLPDLSHEQILSYVMCELNGKFVPEIAAITERTKGADQGRVVKAWRADLDAGKIMEIATDGIVCGTEK